MASCFCKQEIMLAAAGVLVSQVGRQEGVVSKKLGGWQRGWLGGLKGAPICSQPTNTGQLKKGWEGCRLKGCMLSLPAQRQWHTALNLHLQSFCLTCSQPVRVAAQRMEEGDMSIWIL